MPLLPHSLTHSGTETALQGAFKSITLPAAGYRGEEDPTEGGKTGTLLVKLIRGEPAPTLHVVVGFAARNPLAPLETPVVGVRQHHLHKDVVVGRGVEAGDVKTQERKHPPGEERKNTRHVRWAGEGAQALTAAAGGGGVPRPY